MLSEELPSLTGSNEIERIEIAEEANIEQSVKLISAHFVIA